MIYLIDGNNLAGKLDFLGDEDCNRNLEEALALYFADTKKKIIVVFDSLDPLGDKYTKNNLQIIYSPRDGYYSSADDKIMEIIEQKYGQDMVVISDDIEIREKAEEFNQRGYNNLNSQKATDFAFDIKKRQAEQENKKIDNNKGLSDDEIKEINREMLEKFRKKKN
jgi:predicted RNA-binding protein with PIN domain